MGLISSIIDFLGPWSWWVLGLVLLALEIFAPGTVFMWFGVSAIAVGTLALFVEFGWQAEAITFVVLALLAIIASKMLLRGRAGQDEGDLHLNQRGARLIGRAYVLAEPLADGSGRLKIDDTMWRISGPDLPAGTRVRIAAADGALLIVEAAE
jgi:hypothetical protein